MSEQEKAEHFAEIGLMQYATYYAMMTLLTEVREMRKEIQQWNMTNSVFTQKRSRVF